MNEMQMEVTINICLNKKIKLLKKYKDAQAIFFNGSYEEAYLEDNSVDDLISGSGHYDHAKDEH